MLTIKEDISETIVINKSKFICHLYFIDSLEQAKFYIEKINNEHQNANHNCYAYIVGNHERANDDGEPAGTAGIPMLEVLKKNDVQNVLAIVTRYFGGVKLGAGGLVRAYSKSVVETLKKTELVRRKTENVLTISFEYQYLDKINLLLDQKKINVISKNFEERVVYMFVDSSEKKIVEEMQAVAEHSVILLGEDVTYIVEDEIR